MDIWKGIFQLLVTSPKGQNGWRVQGIGLSQEPGTPTRYLTYRGMGPSPEAITQEAELQAEQQGTPTEFLIWVSSFASSLVCCATALVLTSKFVCKIWLSTMEFQHTTICQILLSKEKEESTRSKRRPAVINKGHSTYLNTINHDA